MSIESIRNAGGCAVLSALLLAGEPGPHAGAAPMRLAIYYGYPSLVNGARGDLDTAAETFAAYDIVVLGDGLELDGSGSVPSAGPAEHAFTKQLTRALVQRGRRPELYGYIDLGSTQRLPSAALVDRIERWAAMGVHGVFLDEAGYDFGVTRERQNLAVAAAHARGLRVCLNAFQPGDVFGAQPAPLNATGGGNPSGLAPRLTDRDAFLLESFAVRNGAAEPIERLAERTRAALDGRSRLGTRIFAVATSGADETATLATYGWWMAAAFGLDAYGWGMSAYSAVTSRLPWIERPPAETTLAAAKMAGALTAGTPHWSRATSLGRIVIDMRTRQGSLEPR